MSGGHYDDVAGRYEEACFYDPGSVYHSWLVDRTLAHLEVRPDDRLADLGGGAGGFAAALGRRAGLRAAVTVVEPSAGLRRRAADRDGVVVVAADALGFAQADGESFDRILMKEVVHHLDLARLDELYAGLARRLDPGGRLLTITRPRQPDYPLFAAARAAWRRGQPPWQTFAAAQERAGFRVARFDEVHALRLAREEWFELIRGRCWSTFAGFDDEALEAGIAEIRLAHPEPELRFDDLLIFLRADRDSRAQPSSSVSRS